MMEEMSVMIKSAVSMMDTVRNALNSVSREVSAKRMTDDKDGVMDDVFESLHTVSRYLEENDIIIDFYRIWMLEEVLGGCSLKDESHVWLGIVDKALRREVNKVYDYIDTVKQAIDKNPSGSFSSGREDLLLDYLLGGKVAGYYIDITDHDMSEQSHTLRFYKCGWTGLNVTSSQDAYESLQKQRPGDLTLYSDFPTEDDFLKPATEGAPPRKTLSSIVSCYVGEREVDILSVSANGRELEILRTNDWLMLKPTLVVVNSGNGAHMIMELFEDLEYEIMADNGTTIVFGRR